ncbi:uncharacterized protein Z519_11327 [Cladophialophora bantiana CBS 173.52]|uniref:Uncharacterized protein n=1 Tax=Cladophialophora bantiana (strain ATCC 10958 / CBS 173.52 / CDC B-1940 / NIH 8579) TaxID=1442370 RepID=A0A0D2EDL1_CLAB1|nr:uncharacterized protein Z519_11327 [Cladophialophora bantiana CBS 173.52]KIW88216.1 hypothetical protein Z519_11327 [Cladophialophora bantiana CBS 173.52]
MPVTGLEILPLINGTLKLITLVITYGNGLKTKWNDQKAAADHVAKIIRQFDNQDKLLKYWCFEHWTFAQSISVTKSHQLCNAYWGEDGWVIISNYLYDIQILCDDFGTIFAKLLDQETFETLYKDITDLAESSIARGQRSTPLSNNNHERSWVVGRAGPIDKDRRRLAAKADRLGEVKKFKFMQKHIGKLEAILEEIKTTYNTLARDSTQFFLDRWGSQIGSDHKEARLDVVEKHFVLEHVHSTKLASELLFWACNNVSETRREIIADRRTNKPCWSLAMSLGAMDKPLTDEIPTHQDYRIEIPWPTEADRVVRSVRHPGGGTRRNVDTERSLEDACVILDTVHGTFCDFKAGLPDEAVLSSIFRLRKLYNAAEAIPRLRRDNDIPADHVKVNLYGYLESRAHQHQSLLRPERVKMAFLIADNGMILLGTQWAHHFRSKNLIGPRTEEVFHASEIVLNVPDTEALETRIDNGIDNVEPQLFKIGVLLVELALSAPVHSASYDREGNQPRQLCLETCLPELNTTERQRLQIANLLTRAEQAVGDGMSQAIEFCLQHTRGYFGAEWSEYSRLNPWKNREMAYKNVLSRYYDKVYKPLKDLVVRVREREGQWTQPLR